MKRQGSFATPSGIPSRTNTNSHKSRFFSWFRTFCISGAAVVVCFNASQLTAIFPDAGSPVSSSSSSSSSTTTGNSLPQYQKDQKYQEEEELFQPTNHYSLPPIYWINLDRSVSRRRAMQDMFLRLGVTDTHRVPAIDVNATIDLWNNDRLVFYPNVTLEERDGRPSNKKHVENIYEYQEAACLLSHLEAIHAAYTQGHATALILEDDALLSHSFKNTWKPYVDQAPLDWKILQFATNNPNVVKQGVHLMDPFITWQPYHWSTRAYIINRAGMQTLMDKFYSKSPTGQVIWRIDQDPMVVADEVIYYQMGGDAYTSTGLWVDSQSFGSTIQSNNAHSNLSSLIGEASNSASGLLHRNHYMLSLKDDPRPESILVLMSVVAKDLASLQKELEWIRQDNHVLSQHHHHHTDGGNVNWEINLALRHETLMEALDQQTLNFPSNIHFHAHVTTQPFNKFTYVRNFVDELDDYDLILFKDNDQRIAGFPWRTFLEQKGDAVVAGPLRQNTQEALLWRHAHEKRQYFQFHAAEAWTEDWNTQWSSQLFANVVPTEVPLLEMYFVLMDAKFAHYFFDLVLTPSFVNQTSAWGPDLLWCPAAKEWAEKLARQKGGSLEYKPRPSCHLVPVVSSHEDTQQILKNVTSHKENGERMVGEFKRLNPQFDDWMRVPEKWRVVIGGQLLWQIERRCRKLLKLRMVHSFHLADCPLKVQELVDQHAKEVSAKAKRDAEKALKGITEDASPPTKKYSNGIVYPSMAERASSLLNPVLRNQLRESFLGAIDQRPGLTNKTRVAELVQAVKQTRVKGNVTTVLGTSTKIHPGAPSPDTQRKSLDAFQTRLAELKEARQQRLGGDAEEEAVQDDDDDDSNNADVSKVAIPQDA